MAIKKRDLTISEMLELQWNDGLYTDNDEVYLKRGFEEGWRRMTIDLKRVGHDKLIFDLVGLVI